MLDHPEEMWANYYRYYRRRMAPKVDVRLVLICTISVISAIQVRNLLCNTNWIQACDNLTSKVSIQKFVSIIPFCIQYYSAWSNYEEAIKYLVTVPKYRIQATEIAKNDGLMKRDKKLDKGKTKEQIKEEDEKVSEYNIIWTSAMVS